jgi:DMSO/TMAO reductase YedYZ molybdopterin-dependent catalytic subunit
MALWYLGEQLAGLPFVPFDIFDWLARILPGDVITLGIDTIVRTIDALNLGSTSTAAKTIEQLQAIALVLGGGVVLGVVTAWLLRVTSWRGWQAGALLGLAALVPIIVIEFDLGVLGDPALATLWLALTTIGWAVILASLLDAQEAPQVSGVTDTGRRAALAKIAGGSLAVALGAWGVGRLLSSQTQPTGAGQPLANLITATPEATKLPAVEPSATATLSPAPTTSAQTPTSSPPAATPTMPSPTATATMRDRVQPAPGTRLELTPNEDFYRIDINTRPLVIDGESWVLEVDGLFDNARPLTLEGLMAYSPVTQAITLSCISNRVGGDLIGTSNWTGARLRDVLKDLGLRPEAKELFVEGADGFHDSVAMEDLTDPRTLLVYGMNGETLPVKHGFPLRIYIPNRYGMKQPKWITRIEAIDEEGPGYWVSRGWNAEARPQIVSVIDTVAVEEDVDGAIPLGGIAWAGDRGIQKVEVQVDGGEWVDWPMVSGPHRFRVRATDGTGELQIEEAQGVRPNGATGYHEELIDM